MKSLKPSHRERKRYLLIRGKDATKNNIEKAILEFIGILGYAESGISFLKTGKDEVILVANRESIDRIRSSFLINEKDINIARVSGSIKNIK